MDKIFVCAGSHHIARNFVVIDLQENPAKMVYVERPDQLQGISHFVLFVHPTATENRSYIHIRNFAEDRGAIFARIDDSYSRARHARGG